jgi:cobalamin biosynthesis Mg chelatase CobN
MLSIAALLIVVVFISALNARQAEVAVKDKQQPLSQFEVCKTNDKQACNGHGTCQAFARVDGHRGTRCLCQDTYTGAKCESKSVEKVGRKLQVQAKALRAHESSSSDSEVVVETPEDDDEGSSSDSDDVVVDTASEFSGSDSDRATRHHKTHRRSDTGMKFIWTIIVAIVVICLLCCCIGGIVYWSRRV